MSSASDRMSVFILHARTDSGFADQLAGLLAEAGYAPDAPLRGADAIVFVLSDASVQSPDCMSVAQEAARLATALVPVLPAPMDEQLPGGLVERGLIRFYVDPAVPNSGFFDGQKRLISALEASVTDAAFQRERVHAGRTELNALNKEIKKVREEVARIQREERETRRKDMQRPPPDLPPLYYDRPPRQRGPRFPWLRGGFLLLVALWVIGFFVSDTVSDGTRAIAAQAATWASEVYGQNEPQRERGVSAQDYTPERDAFAGASGANVRDYPLPNATLLAELPARAPLAINGRLMVQGEWWFRVALEDGRVGFVHERAVSWRSPPAAPPAASQAYNVTAVDPAVAAVAGRAGAKIRAGASRSASLVVRVESGAALTITGKRRVGEHWWYRVRTADGQEGFARDDVLTAPGGGALSL
jgi:hypothetical protein